MSRTNKTNHIILKETFSLTFFLPFCLWFFENCSTEDWRHRRVSTLIDCQSGFGKWKDLVSCEGPKNSEIRELQWEDLDIKLHIKTGVYGAISFALRSKHFCGAYLLRIANCFLHNFSPKIHVQNSRCSVFPVCNIYSTKKAKNSLKIMSFSVCLFAERQL